MVINEKDLDKISLVAGKGQNAFTMSRGSFKYRKKTVWGGILRLAMVETVDESTKWLHFDDVKGEELYYIEVKNDGDKQTFTVKPTKENTTEYNRFKLIIPASADEHFYGCGETYSEFDLKGKRVRIFVAEHQNAKRIGMKLIKQKLTGKHYERTLAFNKYESYYAQPTFTSSRKYYVHAELNEYSEFDFTKPGKITFYTQELPKFTIEQAESFPVLSTKLSNMLGRQRKLPDWIYDGAIIAAQDWTVTDEGTISKNDGISNIDNKLKALRDRGAKIAGVWSQDWCGCRCTKFGYQVMWNWEYDAEKYRDLPGHIQRWKDEGVRFLGYINPFIALEKNLYAEAKEKGYCVKDKDGRDYLVTITTFPAAMVDFTNPEAYAWYKEIIKKNMIGIGMGGWMADFGEYLPMDAVLHSGEDPAKLHNQWPAIWARLNYEAINEMAKENEIFFFTRAGHTDTIKYSSMMWTGDQHVDWSVDDGLVSTIPATLSLAMSGYGITHSDVGGYTTVMSMTRSKELLLRWEEMNAFTPLYRFHEGNQPSRNVQAADDDELLAQIAKFSDIHASLGDYIKELVSLQATSGIPVMRPLFYHYDEPECYSIKTEYLLGADILVAPIYKEGATSRDVLLPKDNWRHLFTGALYRGGTHNVSAPIGTPPVFIRVASEKLKDFQVTN